MTAQQRAWSWGLGLAVFIGLFYLLRGVMLPFVAGMAVAYFLDPACDWLERRGASRTIATVIITDGNTLQPTIELPSLDADAVATMQLDVSRYDLSAKAKGNSKQTRRHSTHSGSRALPANPMHSRLRRRRRYSSLATLPCEKSRASRRSCDLCMKSVPIACENCQIQLRHGRLVNPIHGPV